MTSSSTNLLGISRFTSRLAPPTRELLSWQQLAALFSDPRRTSCPLAICRGSTCPHKDGECWSPSVFSGSTLSAQDVEAVSCLVLDVDHVTDAAVDVMRTQIVEYQHLIHVTHSDRLDDRCLRVIVQLSRSVDPIEWPRFWSASVRALSAPIDSTCGDIARCYYLPSRPYDADYFVAVHMGEPLDVDAMLAAAPDPDDSATQITEQEGITP